MQETGLYLNNTHMCWLDKSFASEEKRVKYWTYGTLRKMGLLDP
jgi:hypothetical protein